MNITDDVNYFHLHPALTWVYVITLILVMLVGDVGNILVIGAVIVDKRLRTKGNVFIVNLAIADLTVTGFVMPMSIAGIVVGPQFFQDRDVLCHFIGSVCIASCVCSLWTISTISINRYILICKNHLYSTIFSWNRTILYCILLWIYAWLLDFPNFVEWGDHTYDMKTMACSFDRTAAYSYTITFISLFIVIPLCTVSLCNVHIYLKVKRTKLRVGQHRQTPAASAPSLTINQNHSVSVIKSGPSQTATHASNPDYCDSKTNGCRLKSSVHCGDIKLAKTLFIAFLMFLICWFPFAALCLIDIQDQAPKEVYVVAIGLAHSNSSINCILYAAMNKHFWEGYKLFVKKVFRRTDSK